MPGPARRSLAMTSSTTESVLTLSPSGHSEPPPAAVATAAAVAACNAPSPDRPSAITVQPVSGRNTARPSPMTPNNPERTRRVPDPPRPA